MVQSIPTRHVNALFPFQFHKGLNMLLKTYTSENPVFSLRGTKAEDKLKQSIVDETDGNEQTYFEKLRKLTFNKQFDGKNIYELDQGEFLVLDTMIASTDKEQWLLDEYKKSPTRHTEQYLLLVQIFDDQNQAVLSKNTHLKYIRELSAQTKDRGGVDINSDRLAICLFKVQPESNHNKEMPSNLYVITAPRFLEEQLKQNYLNKD